MVSDLQSAQPKPEPAADLTMTEEVRVCPLCGGAVRALVLEATDLLHGLPGVWGVRRCGSCGFMATTPRPTEGAMPRFYPNDYGPHGSPSAPPARTGLGKCTETLARWVFNPRELLLPSTGIASVLEVGCGSGRLLEQLAGRGWEVWGLEPVAAAVARVAEPLRARVRCADLHTTEYPSGSFDLIVAQMVLEHLRDPLHCANRIAQWLRPGGYLSGSVPNAGSWEFRVFGPLWFALQVPTHLFHFTPGTLRRLLESAGFVDIRVVHQRNVSNLAMQLGRRLERRAPRMARVFLRFPEHGPRSLRWALFPVAAALAAIRQGGRLSFLARLPGAKR